MEKLNVKTGKYHYKEFIPATGETREYLYNCVVLGPVGRLSYRIQIIGAYYKGRPNPTINVRRKNVLLNNPERSVKEYNLKLSYKD